MYGSCNLISWVPIRAVDMNFQVNNILVPYRGTVLSCFNVYSLFGAGKGGRDLSQTVELRFVNFGLFNFF